MTGASGSRDGSQHIVVDMLGLLLAVTVTSAAAGDGAAAPQVPKKAANFGVRQVARMPLAVEQDELRRPVHRDFLAAPPTPEGRGLPPRGNPFGTGGAADARPVSRR